MNAEKTIKTRERERASVIINVIIFFSKSVYFQQPDNSSGARSAAAAMDISKTISEPKRNGAAPSEVAKSAGKKVVIKSADMPEDLQKDAIDIAISAFEQNSVEKDVAEWIKKEFDKKHGPTWHCIVGRNFGSYVTHETNHFVYFYLDQKAVLLFKSG